MLIMVKLNNLPSVRTTSIKLWRKDLNLDLSDSNWPLPFCLPIDLEWVCVYVGGSGSYIKLIGEKHISFHSKWTRLKGKGKHPWIPGNKNHSRSYLSISSASEQVASSSTIWFCLVSWILCSLCCASFFRAQWFRLLNCGFLYLFQYHTFQNGITQIVNKG